MAIKAVIFDYYETLAQLQEPLRVELFDGIARKVGYRAEPGQAYREWAERTTSDVTLRIGGARPEPGAEPFPFRTFRDVWAERFVALFRTWGVEAGGELGAEAYTRLHTDAIAYPEVKDALEALGQRCRLAILSNADDDFLHGSVTRNGLDFELVVSSEEVQTYKPYVSIFREACERLGVRPSEALYVGDQPWADVVGSRYAGLQQAWVNRHGVAWPDDIEPPQFEVGSLDELVSLVDGS